MASAKQRAWRAKFARLYGGGRKKRRSKRSVSIKTRVKRVYSMARRRYGRRSRGGMGGIGGLTSQKNLIGTVGGAILASKMGQNPALGAAAGSYFYGKKGVVGAGVGYFAGPYIASMLGGILGGSSNGSW